MDKEIEKQSDTYKELIKFLNMSLNPIIKDREDFNKITAMYNDNIDWKIKYQKRFARVTNNYCILSLVSALLTLSTSSEKLLYLTLYLAPFPLALHLVTKHLERVKSKNIENMQSCCKNLLSVRVITNSLLMLIIKKISIK